MAVDTAPVCTSDRSTHWAGGAGRVRAVQAEGNLRPRLFCGLRPLLPERGISENTAPIAGLDGDDLARLTSKMHTTILYRHECANRECPSKKYDRQYFD